MSMDLLVRLPDPEEIKKKYPASEKVKEIKAQRDKEIADVFTGKSNKFLLIIGPCSADKEEPVIDYISRLVPVQEQVKDKILIIPRIYTNKPRTTGEGYKGGYARGTYQGKTASSSRHRADRLYLCGRNAVPRK